MLMVVGSVLPNNGVYIYSTRLNLTAVYLSRKFTGM